MFEAFSENLKFNLSKFINRYKLHGCMYQQKPGARVSKASFTPGRALCQHLPQR